MVVVFVLIALTVLSALVGAHWYLWRRFVRDVSRPGGAWRRTGTVLAVLLPLTTVAALVTSRSGAPFSVQRAAAWPGYMWLACLLYLLLALLVGEAARFVVRRTPWGRALGGGHGTGTPSPEPAPVSALADAGGGAGAAADAGGGAPVSAPAPAPASSGAGVGAAGAAGAAGAGAVEAGAGAGAEEAPAEEGDVAVAVRADEAGSAAGVDGAGGSGGPGVSGGAGASTASASVPASVPVPGPAADSGRGVPSRRVFLARTLAVSAGVAGLGTTAAGAVSVLNGPTLKTVTVPLAKLGRRAHGYRIAVVSDIHLGPILGRGHTQRIVDTINGAQPDLVAIVGDLVDGSVADLGPAAEPLRQLRARDGSFFVTGNHEYFGDAREWIDHLRELDVHPLENARRELPGFDLAGVNDVQGEDQGEGPDFKKALGDRDTSRASVLMAHQPVQIHEAVDHHVGLQLSGHTHGGQLWPGPLLAELANPTVAGLERYGDTQLYVTRGAGAWGPPVRVGAESDVTIVKLASPRA
ncbi:metallophosphoesterase [Streptomyces iconiensis]|uniref:Metallophosphoesterase n=1 Tax=Streptomyces iconiensis TaxID=1384038 RepID=A0ABT7AAA2_9ACTN|nr:metallophosphoesterase [Streptomyces iconiensis]MDJ1138288.1 metallophosphoesterase [Streptomyces iconiensis]